MPILPENKARYPKDWRRIREEILKRSGDRCEFCGVPNHAYVKRTPGSWEFELSDMEGGVRIILTIAHLDHTPENCEPSNLRALCQKCHNAYDARHRQATRRERFERLNAALPFAALEGRTP